MKVCKFQSNKQLSEHAWAKSIGETWDDVNQHWDDTGHSEQAKDSMVTPEVVVHGAPLFKTDMLPRCLLMAISADMTKGRLYRDICKKYNNIKPYNLKQKIEAHDWVRGQLRHFQFEFPQQTCSVLVACTKANNYEVGIDREAVEEAISKIPEAISQYSDIVSIHSAMWFRGYHGQSDQVYTSTLKKELRWGGKVEIFKIPRVGSKLQDRENRHQTNFADVFSTDDSHKRCAMTNTVDRHVASKTRWKVKTKKQALLQRIQDRVMANDRQSVKQRMMRDEFRFYTLAAYLRDKYPPPEQRKVSTKWIIEDFSKIDWPGLFPHIDRDVLLKEIQRQEEAINMNIHNINRMAETKPDRYCHPHAQQKTKMRAMEMIKEKNNISSGKNMQGYTFELLLSDTTNTERGHQREMKETIKKQYVEQSFPFINTNGNKRQHQFRPHTKKDECSSHVSRVREVEKELFLNRPADLESQEKLRPVKPFTAKHNLLSKTAPWQEQLKEFNEAVQIDNPTTGDTYHSQLSTEATPTLIYRENASLKMEQLKSQQGADEKLRPFIRQLKRQPINTVIQGYFMQKGILCYLQKDDRAPGGKTPLLVIPETAARHLIFQIQRKNLRTRRLKLKSPNCVKKWRTFLLPIMMQSIQ